MDFLKLIPFDETLLKTKLFFWGGNLLFLAIFSQVAALILVYRRLPPQLPLFYSRPWGNDQLVNKELFIFTPLFLIVLVLINILLAGRLYQKEKLLANIVIFTNILLTFFMTVAFFKILSLTVF